MNQLGNGPDSDHRDRFDELLAKIIRAEESGEPVVRDEIVRQHPELADELNEFFRQRQGLRQLVEPLRDVVARALHVRCPHCHSPIELLDEAALESISCPSCGSNFSLVGDATESLHPAGTKTLGHFKLLEKVGMGQFGSVYKARDTKLDRTVAIKIPRHGQLNGSETEMFLRDARAAAQLKHPNIVGVHEVGKEGNVVYIVSDFIQGATLQEWLKQKRLSPREAAELCVEIAKALHHAHEARVIHRDLKPGNIMMDQDGNPHIVDFGLAKREAGEITMTVEGQILGTPAYMSPEQARGEGFKVDRRTDIYSLGVILFELLTGEIPFRGEKRMLLVQIMTDEAPSPRKLDSAIPRDLETICLKCLAKEPGKRYDSTLQLAHDLERFLFGEPILARPVGRAERLVRWCRRNPHLSGSLAMTLILFVTATVVTTLGYVREANLRQKAETSYQDYLREQGRSSTLQTDITNLEKNVGEMNRQVDNLAVLKTELDASLAAGQKKLTDGEEKLHGTYLQLARSAWRNDQIELADYYLDQCLPDKRNRDWHFLKQQCRPDYETLAGRGCVAISRDRKMVASVGLDHTIKVWDLGSKKLLHTLRGHSLDTTSIDFSRDGAMLASAGGRRVILWKLSDGSIHHTLERDEFSMQEVQFSPDGQTLASVGHQDVCVENERAFKEQTRITVYEVMLWDLATFALRRTIPDGRHVVFNHDGRLLADGNRIWDLSVNDDVSRAPVLQIRNADLYCCPAFHPTRNLIAVALEYSSIVELWNVDTKQFVRRFVGDAEASCITFAADGSRIAFATASSSMSRVTTWNLTTGKKERNLPWFSSGVSGIAFSADTNRLITANQTALTIWDVHPPHDPTEKILSEIVKLDVGPYDSPMWGSSSARVNAPAGKNIPVDWDVGNRDGDQNSERDSKPAGSKNIKWTAPLGSQSYGNPVVANGRIFLGTNNNAGYEKRYPNYVDLGVLLCLEEETGKFLWQHSNEKLPTGRVHDWELQGVCSTPMVDGERLWYVSNRGEVVCLDTQGFYDGEDDGPVQREWARLFDVQTPSDPDLSNPFAVAIESLAEGKLTDYVRSEFQRVEMKLPDVVELKTDGPDKWSFKATVGESEREFHIRNESRRYLGKLAFYAVTTPDDKHEADVVWKFDMMKELGVSQHNMANCSVLTADGLLFVCTSNGLDETHAKIPAPDAPSFMAMDRETGKVIWTDKSPGKNILHAQWASPSYGIFDGQPQVIFPGGDGWVYSFDPKGDGQGGSKLLWKFDGNPKGTKWFIGGRGTRNNIIAFAAIYDGLVYISMGQDPEHGEGQGHLWCIDPTRKLDGSDVSAELAVDLDRKIIAHQRIQAVDESKSERAIANPISAVVWHYSERDKNGDGKLSFEESFHRSLNTPVIKDDILYTADFSGLFHCLNAKTGQVYWTYDLLAACWGSALLVDDKVYIGGEDGKVTIFRHTTEPRIAMDRVATKDGRVEYIPIPHQWAPEVINELRMDNVICMTPIVANNVLYIATRSTLYAIQETQQVAELVPSTESEK